MSYQRLQKAIRHPRLALATLGRRLNQLYYTKFGKYSSNPESDFNVLDEDWDNLIILDSCRYDYISGYDDLLPGQISSRISQASKTREFIKATFTDRHETDLVYVTAVPWWGMLADEINSKVHKFVNLEEKDIQDPELDVELPDVTADEALKIEDKFPNKRLIVHFNQPHYPYIGKLGRKVFPTETRSTLLEDVVRANATRQQVIQAYRENLDETIPEVKRLVEGLQGKTIITADHGEMLGERGYPVPIRDYGHTAGIYRRELVEVPWIECEFDSRKKIVDEEPRDTNIAASSKSRLKKLGYLS